MTENDNNKPWEDDGFVDVPQTPTQAPSPMADQSTQQMPPAYTYAPQPVKKKKSTWVIILVIVLVLLCCCCAVGGVVYYFYYNGYTLDDFTWLLRPILAI
ncbi:MAG TPA: hypothetical protein PKK82_05805 [Anaerolineaceae bacterium]|nr:hypothetical protein [Chloroflexota bacterium]HNY84358.1 hypothetical protein [Anaerolineaceae bacterium]